MTDGPAQAADLVRLERLRARFLDATALQGPVADYWHDDDDLAAYDAVFAARIGWKWDAVVAEIVARGFGTAADSLVVDWGCGSGIASRRFVAALGARQVLLHDRSPRAMEFAAARVREECAAPAEPTATCAGLRPGVLLISHVLDELDARHEVELLELIARSERVVWVEPGSRAVSRVLAQHRDRLRSDFTIVAPCPHRGPCSVLADPDDRHWCHFFAPPPSEVFTDGSWVRAGRELGIDMRSLPYSFVALSRDAGAPPDDGTARALGRAEVRGKSARIHACDSRGLHLLEAFKGRGRDIFKLLRKRGDALGLCRIEHDGSRLELLEPLGARDPLDPSGDDLD